MTTRLPSVAILAGGLATRLRPLTETIPKSLIPVAGKPFVFHQLEQLKRQGVKSVVLCTGHLSKAIEAAVGDGSRFGLSVQYSRDGENPLGTGGAIVRALPLLGDQFFILYGDSYLALDYHGAWHAFQQAGCPALMTVFRNKGLGDKSNALLHDGCVSYDKQSPSPEMDFIDYGASVWNASTLAAYPADRIWDLADALQDLSRKGMLAGFEAKHRFYEIGSHQGLADLERRLTVEKRRAVFLDRDGVINQVVLTDGERLPPRRMEDFVLIPGVEKAVRELKAAGFVLVVVTNQPDVGRGTLAQDIVETMHNRLRETLPLDDIRVCYDDGYKIDSFFRKPNPGMLVSAAEELGLDLDRSYMVGDRWRDVGAGRNAGCQCILIGEGDKKDLNPDYKAPDLLDAARFILSRA